MIHLDRANPTPLTEQIVQQLAGQIQSGQLPPGSRLPSIRKLAATLSVSSATVGQPHRFANGNCARLSGGSAVRTTVIRRRPLITAYSERFTTARRPGSQPRLFLLRDWAGADPSHHGSIPK